jgi:hypothetical protein
VDASRRLSQAACRRISSLAPENNAQTTTINEDAHNLPATYASAGNPPVILPVAVLPLQQATSLPDDFP